MTEIQLDGKMEYEFVIPSLTRDKHPIPQERRDAYFKVLESKSWEMNGGFTIIPNCRGGYRSESGEMLYEDVSIIKTNGKMPLTEKELEAFADYLSQECLFVVKAGERYAYLYEGKPKDTKIEFQYDYGDGSYTEYYLTHSPDDERCIQVLEYDKNGQFTAGQNLYENDLGREISMGDEVLAEIYDLYWKSK
ncbi:hypothetical protein [Desulfosarcina sp.]|uniref:hypothetical protein n=1 Tax=Desulfosarcina sp. TaxID=2027861 RepID=UPI0039706B5B